MLSVAQLLMDLLAIAHAHGPPHRPRPGRFLNAYDRAPSLPACMARIINRLAMLLALLASLSPGRPSAF